MLTVFVSDATQGMTLPVSFSYKYTSLCRHALLRDFLGAGVYRYPDPAA